MCSQQTLGQSSATLNQLPVCLHSHTYLQQPQMRGHRQGLERKVAVSEIYLLREESAELQEGGGQKKGRSEGRKRSEIIMNLRQKTVSIPATTLQLDTKSLLLNTNVRFPLSLIFHRVTSPHREPQGVLLRARPGAQRDTGGRRPQAGLHCHLPLRQRLHTRGRPNPHLHHGGRREAELEQTQTHLHW